MQRFNTRKLDPLRSQAIKAEVIRELSLGADAVVMVSELACGDSDCPEVETIIAVLEPGRPRQRVTVERSLEALSPEDVKQACAALARQREPEA